MRRYEIIPLEGLPVVQKPGDIASFTQAIQKGSASDTQIPNQSPNQIPIQPGDIVAVCHTFLGKIYGHTVELKKIIPTAHAQQLATLCEKDPRLMQLLLDQSKDVVRVGPVTIFESKAGIIGANAGVDKSNVPGDDRYVCYPPDPNALARQIAKDLQDWLGFFVPVIITDSVGRPFREGSSGVAIGSYGIKPLISFCGQKDLYGRRLQHSDFAIADPLASIADLAMGKAAEATPAVILRGWTDYIDQTDAKNVSSLIRAPELDLFRPWDWESTIRFRRTYKNKFSTRPVARETRQTLVEFAVSAPNAHNAQPWRFIDLTSYSNKEILVNAMAEAWRRDLKQDNHPEAEIHQRLQQSHDSLIQAPGFFVVCCDPSSMHRYPDTRRQEFEYIMGTQSVAAATCQFLLAAEGMGLAGRWMSAGLFAQEEIRKILQLPESWIPQALVLIGYAQDQDYRPADRISISKTLFEMDNMGKIQPWHAIERQRDGKFNESPYNYLRNRQGGVHH